MAAMTGNAIREALEPFAKLAEILTDDGGWKETDVLELIAEGGDREFVGTLTVGDLRRARTAYDAIGSGVKADEALAEHFARLSETLRSIETLPRPGDLYYAAKNDGEDTGWRYTTSGVLASDIHQAAHALSRLSPVDAVAKADRPDIRAKAQNIVDQASDTYRKLNGHLGSIEGEDGEKCWIVPFDAMEELRAALSTHTAAGAGPVEPRRMAEGCCSAISPCGHQQRDPYSICDVCTRAAGAGPVSEAVAPAAIYAILKKRLESDRLREGHLAYISREIAALCARPVEPGEVERDEAPQTDGGFLTKGERAAIDKLGEATALRRELAEARGLIRDAIGLVPLAHQNWHTDARTALGDAQEAGR